MDYILIRILSSLAHYHPIEHRIQALNGILSMANEGRDIFIYGDMYDCNSILLAEDNLKNYLRALENPQCYISPDDTDINLEAYHKMFGEYDER